jgi:hypothetical protein
MSTEIDYQRKAYHYQDKYGDRCYVVLSERGSSNCYELDHKKRARNWYVWREGPAYHVYGEIARYAGSASGGMLAIGRMGNRSGNYLADIQKVLKAYDKALQASKPIEDADGYDKEMIRLFREKKAVA